MRKKLLIVLLVVTSFSSLCAYAVVPASASELTLGSAVSPNIGQHQISIDDSSNGATIYLPINDTLTITLQSNPSTGASWQLDQIDTSVLQNVSHQYVPPPPPAPPGKGGTEVWVFKPVTVGTSPVVMEYGRPGETAAKTYNLTVNVTPPVPASSNLAIGILMACFIALISWLTIKRPRQSQT
jgi:predicted secreted protein